MNHLKHQGLVLRVNPTSGNVKDMETTFTGFPLVAFFWFPEIGAKFPNSTRFPLVCSHSLPKLKPPNYNDQWILNSLSVITCKLVESLSNWISEIFFHFY